MFGSGCSAGGRGRDGGGYGRGLVLCGVALAVNASDTGALPLHPDRKLSFLHLRAVGMSARWKLRAPFGL